MELLFATTDNTPAADTRGELAIALPKALRSLGHRITVVSPLYSIVDVAALALARRLTKIQVKLGSRPTECEVYDGRTPTGVELIFLGEAELFRKARSLEDGGDPNVIAARAALFARATAGVLQIREPRFELLHALGWTGALVVVAAQQEAATEDIPTVLTVRDVREQGELRVDLGALLGLDLEIARSLGLGSDRSNALVAGLKQAGRVTTLSRAYAQELRNHPREELRAAFTALDERLVGIVDGVDASVWNPATDPKIKSRFDPMDLEGKARCKADLQLRLELPLRTEVPLFVAFASSDPRAGFDLLAAAGPDVLRNEIQLAVQLAATSGAALQTELKSLAARWPDRMKLLGAEDDATAHRLLSAADFVVAPSREEPCHLIHLLAHRYGALPVVRRIGCAADTVVDCDPHLESGSGFVFDTPSADELCAAMQRACAAFSATGSFDALRRRTMRLDHSWERAGRLYEAAYRDLTTPRT